MSIWLLIKLIILEVYRKKYMSVRKGVRKGEGGEPVGIIYVYRGRWGNMGALTRALLGGGAISSPPSGFLAISSKPMQVSPPNLQYPLSQQFYTLC